MNKITPYIIVFITGIILGCISYCGISNRKGDLKIVHDSIIVMSEPKTIIDSFPYPVYISSKSSIPNVLPTYLTDTIVDSTKCCNKYISCIKDYNLLYNYTDTMLKFRFYNKTIEDEHVKIIVRDTTLGKLIYVDLTYFIKPIPLPKSHFSLIANVGYDYTLSNSLIGIDILKNKFSIGYMGNIKNENLIKVGYKLY